MSNTVATRTRGARRREQKHSLPIHPVVAVHVARVSALYHDETFEQTARVCVAWQKGSSQARHLKKCSSYGELKSGKRYARFDRPHAAAFLPDGNLVIADCDNFRLQTWSRAADSYMIQERDLGATACPTGVISEGSFLYIVEHGATPSRPTTQPPRPCPLAHASPRLWAGSHRVVKTRASSGSLVAAAGQWGGADGELRHPWGLASSGKAIYVVDGGNARICCFALSNLAFRFAFGDGGFGPEGQYRLVDPKGIAHHAGPNTLRPCTSASAPLPLHLRLCTSPHLFLRSPPLPSPCRPPRRAALRGRRWRALRLGAAAKTQDPRPPTSQPQPPIPPP